MEEKQTNGLDFNIILTLTEIIQLFLFLITY